MNGFLKFMQSTAGRLARMLVGIVLIVVGIMMVGGGAGAILAVVGAVPLLAGVLGVCLFAPLFGYTLHGEPRVSARI